MKNIQKKKKKPRKTAQTKETMKTNKKLKLGETGFWAKWFAKLFFTLISVKVWGLITGTIVSTWLLMVHLHNQPLIIGDKIIEYGINGAQWVTFNTTLWALIFGMKEIFRISEQHELSEQENLKDNLDHKIRIAGMLSGDVPGEDTLHARYPQNPPYERVGNDPEKSEKP